MKTALLLLALLPPPAAAQEPAPSTAAARAASPLMLTFSKDAYRSRVGLDYAIRWDFSDLKSLTPGLGLLYSGVRAVAGWDITENTRVEYYGFRTNPWRLIITKEKKNGGNGNGAVAAPAGANGGGVVSRATPEYRKRLRLSVSPLVDDLKRNFDDGLRDYLLRSSLKKFSPEWERIGQANRQAVVKDVLSIGLFSDSVPVLREAGEGLEYLSNGKPKTPANGQGTPPR